MSEPYHNMRRRVEQVLLTYLQNVNGPDSDVNLYTSMSIINSDGLQLPYIAVVCPGTEHTDDFAMAGFESGVSNRMGDIHFLIRTRPEDVTDSQMTTFPCGVYHDMLVGKILDAFYQMDIVNKLNQVGIENIHIDNIYPPSEVFSPASRTYETTLSFKVYMSCNPD